MTFVNSYLQKSEFCTNNNYKQYYHLDIMSIIPSSDITTPKEVFL